MDKEVILMVAKFRTELEKARKKLAKISGEKLKAFDVQMALAVHFTVQHSFQLVAKNLTAEQMVEILSEFDFSEDKTKVYDKWVKKISMEEKKLPTFEDFSPN